MVIATTNLFRSLLPCCRHILRQFPLLHTISSSQTLEQTVEAAVEAKSYQKIPDLLNSHKLSCQNPNPFSFLSTYSPNLRTQVIDEILQSLIPLRPRSRPKIAYDCLLAYTLQSSNLLPLSLAIIQRVLRSGCLPVPQTKLLLSLAWIERCRQCQSQSVGNILLEMESIGYHPDCGTCNYLMSSLCAVDKLQEAVQVLKGMGGARCIPDLESYGNVIDTMCTIRKTTDVIEMVKEMVVKIGLTPRQGTVVKVAAALRANREIWEGVEMIEFLEKEGCLVEFEAYELVLEGCLECKEYVLAGKVMMGMTEKGFIPYIKVRQKVVEELANTGEWKLACTVRQRLTELSS